VTLGLGEMLALGLAEELALGLGEELALGLGEELALGLGETPALRVGKLPIAFLAVLPHPAAMHPATTIAAERARLLERGRMPGPSARLFKDAAGAGNPINDPADRTIQASPAKGELGPRTVSIHGLG
jgi:hypothetical protein